LAVNFSVTLVERQRAALRGEEIGVLFVDKNILDDRDAIDEKAQFTGRLRRESAAP
jgi:hypothetical protein